VEQVEIVTDQLHVVQSVIDRHWVSGKFLATDYHWAFTEVWSGFHLIGACFSKKNVGINRVNVEGSEIGGG
jgi:hypothetical protein